MNPTTKNELPRTAVRVVALPTEGLRMDAEQRTVELSFSSDAPVEMRGWDGTYSEILDHTPSAVRMDRLKNRAALLFNHDRDNLIGVVESARFDGGKGYATVRFSKSEEGQKRFNEVQDGILANVSVGYIRHRVVSEGDGDGGVETVRVTDWEPFEVSLVSVPADISVGVGRNAPEDDGTGVIVERAMKPITKEKIIMDEATNHTPPVNVVEVRAEAQKAERKRVSDIDQLARTLEGKNINVRDEADKAKSEGLTLDQFRALAIEKMPNVSKAKPVDLPKETGRQFSIARALSMIAKGKTVDGFEGEISREINLQTRRDDGFVIPIEALGMRTMTAASGSAGGYSIQEDLLADMFIDKLDNRPRVVEAGAVEINGLVGDVAIPNQTGGATAYWIGETEENDDSELTLGIKRATPHRLAVDIPWSYQLQAQSAIAFEQLVRMDAQKRINIAKDLAAFQGTGTDAQPKGLFNYDTTNSGINTVTYGAAAVFSKITAAEAELLTDNSADLGSLAWMVSPATYAKWAAKSRDTGSGQYLYSGGLLAGNVNGVRAFVSNHLPSNKTVLGAWNQMLSLTWQGVRVILDETTNKKSGIIEIHMEVLCDLLVRQTSAFVVSTDSGAQ